MKRAICALALSLWVFSNPLLAQTVDTSAASSESKAARDVDIEADQMEAFDAKKMAVFTGNVRGKRGTVTLTCNKLTVNYTDTPDANGEKKTEVTFLDAQGDVTIVTTKQTVTGSWAKMDVKNKTVNVGGNVKVVQGNSVIVGEKLFVDLDKNISQMTGGRVKGSFVPAQ